MLLTFADGEPFAIGATHYVYRPATPHETTPRIMVEVEVGSLRFTAFVDTGGVYFLCDPAIARIMNLNSADGLGRESVSVRGRLITGVLHRLPVTMLAEEGEDVTIDATVLVPDDEHLDWDNFPCILGMQGCMERLRFAVEPAAETFYFGLTD